MARPRSAEWLVRRGCIKNYQTRRVIIGQVLDQHWIFDLAEQDPERLLSLSKDEFRSTMADSGFDVEELAEQFHCSIEKLISKVRDTDRA